jgi:hypothetical protein
MVCLSSKEKPELANGGQETGRETPPTVAKKPKPSKKTPPTSPRSSISVKETKEKRK